jgi:hypothetical protein
MQQPVGAQQIERELPLQMLVKPMVMKLQLETDPTLLVSSVGQRGIMLTNALRKRLKKAMMCINQGQVC